MKKKALALALVLTSVIGGLLTGKASVLASNIDQKVSESSVVVNDSDGPERESVYIDGVSDFNFGTIVSSDTVQQKISESENGIPNGGVLFIGNADKGPWSVSVKEDSALLSGGTIVMQPTYIVGGQYEFVNLSPRFTLNISYRTVIEATQGTASGMYGIALLAELSIPANTLSGEYDSTITWNLENTI